MISMSDTTNDCGRQCFIIGGPFIAEDPDCPVHGRQQSKKKTFPTGILTVSEEKDGWYKCDHPHDCVDAREAGLVTGVPHIHHDGTPLRRL